MADEKLKSAEPTPRFWHHAIEHGGQVYVRGGRTPYFKSDRSRLTATLERFDPVDELWKLLETEGTPHLGITQTACVCVSDTVYMYGSDRKVLSELNMKTFEWSQLWTSSETDNGKTPMIKDACGIVYFHDRYLGVFGGYASPSGPLQPGSKFHQSPYGGDMEGWTNEFHIFNINKKVWLSPAIKGTRPPPCCDFTLNGVNSLRAILFGGFQDNGFQDELYIVDFNPSEMDITFTLIEKKRPWPEGRECHSACVLGYSTDHPQLLISGGKNMYDHPLKFDVWMLDISSLVWKNVTPPGGKRQSRWGHTMTAVSTCPGLEAVVVFGGSPEDFGKKWNSPEFPRLAATAIFYFGNLGSEWVLLEERIKTDESPLFFDRTSNKSQLSPFYLESNFSMRQIFLMEKAYGTPLLTELASKNQAFQQLIQVRQPDTPSALIRWLSSSGSARKMEPTWRNLSLVLHKIDLGPVALQMEGYLINENIRMLGRLEADMLAHCDKLLDKGDALRQRMHMFASHSDATIHMMKTKYDDLKVDVEELRWQMRATTGQARSEEESVSSLPLVKTEPKQEIATVIHELTPPTLVQRAAEPNSEEGYWRGMFQTLSDKSDSTIQMLKKENRQLRDAMDRFKGQAFPGPVQKAIETEMFVRSVKVEPEDDIITVAEPQPCSSASLFDDSQLSLLDEEFIEHSHSPTEPLEHQCESEMLSGEENGESLEASDSEDLSSDEVDGVINGTKTIFTEPELLFSPAQPDVGDFELRGVDVCGEVMLVVTNSAQDFEWEKYGLKLHISEGTLPEGVRKCRVRIKASTAGQYNLPENFCLVSAIFWLRCEPPCMFAKSIAMEMEHCAATKVENTSKLCFVRALCSQEELPYDFKKIEEGRFGEESRYGIVELSRFSGVGIAEEKAGSTQQEADQREYSAIIFHSIKQRVTSYRIDFVVTWNTKTHLTAVKEEYENDGAEKDNEFVVEFESESITIDVPWSGIAVEGGWKLSPLTEPTVLKKYVDRYEQGKMIPKCQFSANVVLKEEDEVPPLQHRVRLIGSKSPFNSFMFEINPPELGRIGRKRSSSESDVLAAKRKRSSMYGKKSRSLDSKHPPIYEKNEDIDSDASSPVSNSNPNETAAQLMEKPKLDMASLMVLKWRDAHGTIQKFRLKPQIYHLWRDIGNFVQVSWQTLEVLKEKDASYCCEVVLQHWLSSPPSGYPATWEGLYELLEDCELGKIVDKLKVAVENAV